MGPRDLDDPQQHAAGMGCPGYAGDWREELGKPRATRGLAKFRGGVGWVLRQIPPAWLDIKR